MRQGKTENVSSADEGRQQADISVCTVGGYAIKEVHVGYTNNAVERVYRTCKACD